MQVQLPAMTHVFTDGVEGKGQTCDVSGGLANAGAAGWSAWRASSRIQCCDLLSVLNSSPLCL